MVHPLLFITVSFKGDGWGDRRSEFNGWEERCRFSAGIGGNRVFAD